MYKPLLWCLLVLCSESVSADVYRWVDKDGKVHYTDKKPAPEAEDITRQVSKQNIDTSSEELRKVEQILRKEKPADQDFYNAPDPEEQAQRTQRCKAARQRQAKISGRVIFIGDDGKVVKVTEQERQHMLAELNGIISENCAP